MRYFGAIITVTNRSDLKMGTVDLIPLISLPQKFKFKKKEIKKKFEA